MGDERLKIAERRRLRMKQVHESLDRIQNVAMKIHKEKVDLQRTKTVDKVIVADFGFPKSPLCVPNASLILWQLNTVYVKMSLSPHSLQSMRSGWVWRGALWKDNKHCMRDYLGQSGVVRGSWAYVQMLSKLHNAGWFLRRLMPLITCYMTGDDLSTSSCWDAALKTSCLLRELLIKNTEAVWSCWMQNDNTEKHVNSRQYNLQ